MRKRPKPWLLASGARRRFLSRETRYGKGQGHARVAAAVSSRNDAKVARERRNDIEPTSRFAHEVFRQAGGEMKAGPAVENVQDGGGAEHVDRDLDHAADVAYHVADQLADQEFGDGDVSGRHAVPPQRRDYSLPHLVRGGLIIHVEVPALSLRCFFEAYDQELSLIHI